MCLMLSKQNENVRFEFEKLGLRDLLDSNLWKVRLIKALIKRIIWE